MVNARPVGYYQFINRYFDVVDDSKPKPLLEYVKNESKRLALPHLTQVRGADVDSEGFLVDASGKRVKKK